MLLQQQRQEMRKHTECSKWQSYKLHCRYIITLQLHPTKSYEINISLFITFARPSEKYHVCPAVSVPKQCRVSALVSASCFRSSSASRSLRWRSWSESSIVTSSSCMQCGNIQIPTATVQGTQGCLHKSCKIIIPGPFWHIWYPVACLSALFNLVHTQCIRETAAACDRRFCSSSVSRTRRCDSCSKSWIPMIPSKSSNGHSHSYFQ